MHKDIFAQKLLHNESLFAQIKNIIKSKVKKKL